MAFSIKKFMSLNWRTPLKILPHGLSGLVAMVIGCYFVSCALFGNLHYTSFDKNISVVHEFPPSDSLTYIYIIAIFINAVAGFLMSGSAPKGLNTLFKLTATLNLSFIYFAWRFYEGLFLIKNELLHYLDMFFSVLIVIVVFVLAWTARSILAPMFGNAVAGIVMISSFSLILLSGYPLQLAYSDLDWYSCVLEKFTLQRIVFVYYVYVPCTWAFAAMLFGATLVGTLGRKIISPIFFAFFFGVLVLGTLFSTILLQEVHLPEISTQKILIFCPDLIPLEQDYRSEVPWFFRFIDSLDTNAFARYIINSTMPHLLFKEGL